MTLRPLLCLLFLALPVVLQAQDDPYAERVLSGTYAFQVRARIDQSSTETLELELEPGATDTLDLGNGYRVAITAPALAPEGTESALLVLSRSENERWLPLHTYRQPLRGRKNLLVGYRVCRQQVTLHYPVGDAVPAC